VATTSSQGVTQSLRTWSRGEGTALEALIPPIYKELRQRAHRRMGRERRANSLQTTEAGGTARP